MAHKHKDVLIALTGQPNSGKSTIFNMLTGIHQRIGNYPGVTVEKKSGHFHDGEHRIEVVDLPGTYSLTSYTQEERVTRDFILLEQPELLVVVVDAANLRRHLYLVYQLLEMQVPLIVCLNMMDMAKRRGLSIDIEQLEKELGVPVVPTIGKKFEGGDKLRQAILDAVSQENAHESTGWKMDYGEPLEAALAPVVETLAQKEHLIEDFSPRWLAVKLFELDREARRIVQHHTHDENWESVLEQVDKTLIDFEKEHNESPLKVISRVRDRQAETIEVRCTEKTKASVSFSDKIDKLVCQPIVGLIIAILIMILAFQVSFGVADKVGWIPWGETDGKTEFVSPVGVCEFFFEDWIPEKLNLLLNLDEESALRSLLYDGIIAGVGGVIVFVPVIFCIFIAISILEQCGYMARLGMVMHRLMKFFGLHGNSVLPMILGGGIAGGCAIPAIMATRTMREPKERLLTILVIPFMNCGAKLPVYAVLTGVFFKNYEGIVFASLVLISWLVALVVASLLNKTLLKGESMPLVIELPAYQFPSIRGVFLTALQQSWWFVKKAGTIILAVTIVLWALMYYPRQPETEEHQVTEQSQMEYSYAGRVGKALEPVGSLAGFDWKDNVALFGGFAAKEVIVSTLGTMYSMESGESENPQSEDAEEGVEETPEVSQDTVAEPGETAPEDAEEDEEAKLRDLLEKAEGWTPLRAYAMMIFVMLYAPCFPACIAMWKETRSLRWTLTAMILSTLIAFIAAVAIFQIGSLIM